MPGLLNKSGWRPSIKPKMGKSSAKERFTLLFVSSRGRSRTIGFSVRTLRVLGWLGIAALASALFFVGVFRANSKELAGLRYMRVVAESQREQIRALQDQYAALNERVRDAETRETEIRDMLDREGIAQKQSYIPGSSAALPAVRSTTVLSSRDDSSSFRLASPVEMGRALYALNANAGALEEKAVTVERDVTNLHDEVTEIVSRIRATPSVWPVNGHISSDFGWRANPFDYYDSEYHSGVDIAAQWGEPICAPADGTVSFSGYKYGYGWTVTIEHGYGYETLYAHCSALDVDKWQDVKRGEVIAYVGESGNSTGPHLHYEIHLWGSKVDPAEYLP